MKPTLSVIFFTVSSGAGFGLMALLVLADVLQWGGGLSGGAIVGAGLIALALVTAGLLSSTLHLANPKNAWRAFSRFRTSWLSREGVFAVAFYPFALCYLLLAYLDIAGVPRAIVGAGTIALAWITVYSTGMIYASLKPIPQWHTPLVPIAYFVLGHYSGALLLFAVLVYGGQGAPVYLYSALTWLALAAAVKAIYYAWMRRPGVGATINTATGISRARVRLLDDGHSHGTFLTNEFGFILARKHAVLGKVLVFVVGFLVPLGALLLAPPVFVAALFAAAAATAGLIVERWFFFAEARHVVRLYHGL
ncbi:MAG: DmsC/YnfH family molybdoenzyme membrane anchor subunit [Betaproteobacteria bacterium]